MTDARGMVEEASLPCNIMRRRRRKVRDEGQSSLDRFAPPQSSDATDAEASVPSMPDLDLLEAAEARLNGSVSNGTPPPTGDELRSFAMPSASSSPQKALNTPARTYHDLDTLYPNAPVPLQEGEMVIHNSTLLDLTGCDTIMNWISEDHGCVVEMKRMMNRTTEFNQALQILNTFVQGDVQGQIIRITDTRLLILPRGCRGIRGTDMEGFAVSPDDLTDVYE